jgi:predicted Zn-dependent peptidase
VNGHPPPRLPPLEVATTGLVPVAVCRVERAPVAAVVAHLRFGSRHEPRALSGVTHVFEHLLLRRPLPSCRLPLPAAVERLGGEVNAATAREDLFVYARVPAFQLESALALVAETVVPGPFPRDLFEAERRIVLEELHGLRADAEEVAYEELHASLFDGHGLGAPLAGTEEGIAALDLDGLGAFVAARLHAGTLGFAVVADVRADEIVQALEHSPVATLAAGRWLPDADAAPLGAGGQLPLVFQAVPGERVCGQLGGPGLAYRDGRRRATEVVATLVGGTTTSLLFERIRSALGLTYAVSAWHRSYTDTGLFRIEFVARPENVERTFAAVEEALADKLARGWCEEEVAAARLQREGTLLLEFETGVNLAVTTARMRLLARDPDWTPEGELAGVRAVTADEVNATARQLAERPLQRVAAGPPS